MFEYYARNTHVRCLDTDEDPKPCPAGMNLLRQKQVAETPAVQRSSMSQLDEEVVVKEVKNIHICSDH